MPYNLIMIDSDGEEFPYSEHLDEELYCYYISIILGDRDGELQVRNSGVHIEFDKGDWLDFIIPPPRKLFPDQKQLSQEDLLKLMGFLWSDKVKTKSLSVEDVENLYKKYGDYLSKKTNT